MNKCSIHAHRSPPWPQPPLPHNFHPLHHPPPLMPPSPASPLPPSSPPPASPPPCLTTPPLLHHFHPLPVIVHPGPLQRLNYSYSGQNPKPQAKTFVRKRSVECQSRKCCCCCFKTQAETAPHRRCRAKLPRNPPKDGRNQGPAVHGAERTQGRQAVSCLTFKSPALPSSHITLVLLCHWPPHPSDVLQEERHIHSPGACWSIRHQRGEQQQLLGWRLERMLL